MKVIIAQFFPNGNENRIFDLSPEQIADKKKEGWLVKEQIGTYRPGFYTKKQEFLAAKGKNF